MAEYLEIEALDTLIKELQEYQEELQVNERILLNAANVCDAARGSDEVIRRHIANLNRALEKLKRTSEIVSEVAEALVEEKRKAIDIVESIR